MEWNFRVGGRTENPKNAAIKEFSKHPFDSLVREAVQNSLDNPSGDEPVAVKFTFSQIEKSRVPGYEKFESHLNALYEYWQDDPDYRSLLEREKKRFNQFKSKISTLRIEDSNTKGMGLSGNSNIRKTKYFAFSRGNNSVHDQGDSGGSEGQGKAALFALSALRTIFVHSVSEQGSIYEGLTMLATHKIGDQEFGSDGYYGNDIETPCYEDLLNQDRTRPFRRVAKSQWGTAITILGLWEYNEVDINEIMIKSAINNFWFAIWEQKLIIEVNDTIINRTNLEARIDEYLPDRSESSRAKKSPAKYGRARCYFESWTKHRESYEETLPYLGTCILRISEHEEYPGKIAFFRKPKMLIVRSSVGQFVSKGYCGVFICTSEKGNRILRKMEGKTHTEWNPKYFTETPILAKKAMQALLGFIKRSWEDYKSKHHPETIDFKGLDENMPTLLGRESRSRIDVSQKSKRREQERDKGNSFSSSIMNEELRSRKVDGNWKYSIDLVSDETSEVQIKITAATDAVRSSKNEQLGISPVGDRWKRDSRNLNVLHGKLESDIPNRLEFFTNRNDRVGLKIKVEKDEI